jgi:2'-5' RNA ligase
MRQFLALALSDALRREVAALSERLAGSTSGWRFVPDSAVHLTLRFLGDVDEIRDRSSRDAWRVAAAESAAFSYRLEGLGVFPERGRPRILWAGVAEPGAGGGFSALAGRLELAARAAGFEPEERPFHPHWTLARALRNGRATPPRGVAFSPDVEARVEVVSLFRSELGPTGARYTCLEQFPLAGQT